MYRILRSESGSIVLITVVALVVLVGFTAFVVDHGVLMVGRSQAQHAADAAALGGAVARAFDEVTDPPSLDGWTVRTINTIVDANAIVGASGTVSGRTWSWDCPRGYDDAGACVHVNVYRNGEQDSPYLPVFFGYLVGVDRQGTRATATAIARLANGSTCLKPWLIPDKWDERGGSPTAFDVGIDQYTNPGWTTDDIGTTLTLSPGNPHEAIAPSDFYQLTDGTEYPEAITGCTLTQRIGDRVEVFPGGSFGLTRHAVADLIANNDGNPVTVIIGMFDPAAFAAQARQSGKYDLQIVNMMAFRITGMSGNALMGTICAGPGDILPGDPFDTGGHLVRAIQLIR